jgi:heat shock protein HslJ
VALEIAREVEDMSPSIKRARIPAWCASMLVLGMFIEVMAQAIQGTAWNAVELYGTAVPVSSDVRDGGPYLVFGPAGRMSGADGCTHLTGPYTVTASAITFGHIAETPMACPRTEEVARRFREALVDASYWRIVMGRLEFYDASGKPLAIFEQRPSPSNGPLTLTATHTSRFGSTAPSIAR